jgi:quercetin dioxygenase-like cupin family protein
MVQPVANLKNIDKDEDMAWQQQKPGFWISDVWARSDPKVGPNDERRYVDIQAYKLENGATSEAHFHSEHFELVMVWSGKGHVRYAAQAAGKWPVGRVQALKQFDTMAIPPRTLHAFQADPGGAPFVLVTVHALGDRPLDTTVASFGSEPDTGPELKKRSVADLGDKDENWEPSRYRARRIRVWGKEARMEPPQGGQPMPVDANKGQFQFTLYTFNTEQENPGHFHPHSVEFVFALTSSVEFTIRPKDPRGGWHPEANQQWAKLVPGDMVLVPLAGWHLYVNKSKTERSMVMAMQTPHPIMHTLLCETDGAFDPQKSVGGLHVL